MDNGFAGSDPTIFSTITPSHSTHRLDSLINLVRQPALPSMGSNLPLPGLYETASRIKYEDMAGIFSRAAAAHLYEKTAKHPELSFSSPSACDLRACQSQSSTVPAFDTMDIAASSTNSFNSPNSSNYMVPSLVHPVTSTMREQGAAQFYELPETDCYSLVSPSSFSEFMLHAMEISEATTSMVMPASGLPPASQLDQNSSLSEDMASSLMYSKLSAVLPDDSGATPNMPESPNSPSKQDSSVLSAEDSDVDRKFQSNTKRRNCGLRKTQQKKVVCVPFGESKQKGEAPPSDTWAWRKYGQKPIKGSPFPRGYYRCSSSKGCPARKQVERSRNDPTMVMVTYTTDHNHPWPANRSSNSSKAGKPSPSKDRSQSMEDSSRFQKIENLFSSIINFPNAVDEQVVSSMDSLQEEESFFLQRDVNLCLSRTNTEGDDVFDNLGELPELSAIFSKGYVEGHFDEEKFEQPELL